MFDSYSTIILNLSKSTAIKAELGNSGKQQCTELNERNLLTVWTFLNPLHCNPFILLPAQGWQIRYPLAVLC